jgi:uncharacterized protein
MTHTLLLLTWLFGASPAADDAARIREWRSEQDARMRSPKSPLARLAIRQLSRGHNVLGSGPNDALRFAEPGVPASAADFMWDGGTVQLEPLIPILTVDGQPAVAGPLRWGANITLDPLTLTLEGGPDAPRLSVSDVSLPQFMKYNGLRYLPVNDAYRVPATFVAADNGRTLTLDTSTGGKRVMPHKGTLHFQLDGKDLSLDGFGSGERPNDLFVIFKDASNGKETYGPGRFVWVQAPVDGKTVIDFNLAWNPLCAYSHSFSCPLAPSQNHLPVRVPVGEATFPLDDGHGR